VFGFNTAAGQPPQPSTNWCNHPLRPGLEKLKEVKTSRPWFKVYDVGNGTFAICEPYNWEETISYLIIGQKRALLFDSGMGLDSISLVVKSLTGLPVIVLNSHTHPDHIGGNTEFGNVYAMNTGYTRFNAAHGYSHNNVKWEVSESAFCLNKLPGADTAHYHTRPFRISKLINNGHVIDLGGRQIKVIATPGHTPDAICIYDKQAGYFWCGDSFYEGPIVLTEPHTNLAAYKKSINLMARYARLSRQILPAHNLPISKPALLLQAARDFNSIFSGTRKGKPGDNASLLFDCGKFSYQIKKELLAGIGHRK